MADLALFHKLRRTPVIDAGTSQHSRWKSCPVKMKHKRGPAFWGMWMTIAALVIGVVPGYAQPRETRFEVKECISGSTARGWVHGYVPAEIDLGNESTARA